MYFCSVQIKQFHYISRNRFFKIFKQGLKPLEQFYSCIIKDSLMVENTEKNHWPFIKSLITKAKVLEL
jgi:hypothetical protein